VFGKKRYSFGKTKDDALSVGIDMISEEEKQKRLKRAARFGSSVKDKKDVRRQKFGVSALSKIPICHEPRTEPVEDCEIRPEAMHIYGLDNMSTGDIKAAFGDYKPSHIEWINLSSANVVWNDHFSCSRALWALGDEIPASDLVKTRGECTNPEAQGVAEGGEDPSDSGSADLAAKEVPAEAAAADPAAQERSGPQPDVVEAAASDADAAAEVPATTRKADEGTAADESKKAADAEVAHEQHENPQLRWRLMAHAKGALLLRCATTKDYKRFGAKKPAQYAARFGRDKRGNAVAAFPSRRKRNVGGPNGVAAADGDSRPGKRTRLVTVALPLMRIGGGHIDRRSHHQQFNDDVSPKMRSRLGNRVDPQTLIEREQDTGPFAGRMFADGRDDSDTTYTQREHKLLESRPKKKAVALRAALTEDQEAADYESEEEEAEEVLEDEPDEKSHSREGGKKGQMYSDKEAADALVPAWS